MDALKNVIAIADSSRVTNLTCSNKSLLKDLSGNHEASTYYEQLLEATCDDVLEIVDKKIDTIAKFKTTDKGEK